MKLLRLSLLFVAAILLGISCKPIRVADLQVQTPLATKLPTVEAQIDQFSFQTNYALDLEVDEAFITQFVTSGKTETLESPEVYNYSRSMTYVAEKRLQDAIVLFEREVHDNISDAYGQSLGTITCKIPYGRLYRKGWYWTLASTVTATIPNWFGMPTTSWKAELELEVEIKNCKGDVVGRYRGYGEKVVPVAAWWGYKAGETVKRKANIEAIKMAMEEIKPQIDKEIVALTEELNACK